MDIVHASRETNTITDHLAKLGRKSKSGLKVFEVAPESLKSYLLEDMIGSHIPRVFVE